MSVNNLSHTTEAATEIAKGLVAIKSCLSLRVKASRGLSVIM